MIQYYNPHFLVCTFFGLGLVSKKFPGTIGSLVAIPFSYILIKASNFIQDFIEKYFSIDNYNILYALSFALPLILIFFVFLIGILSASRYSALTKKTDPSEVIIDEVVGQALSIFVTIPLTFAIISNVAVTKNITVYYDLVFIIVVLCNFLLFRIFDIAKPWPISLCDQKIKGGIGIMIDDVVAALFAIVIYFAVLFFVIDRL